SSTRVESSEDTGLGDQEDASKQGRIIDNLDADVEVTLVDETRGRNDQDMFDTSVLDDEEVVAKKEVSTANPVTIAGEVVTTVGVETSKPKAKGIMMQEPSETPTLTPIVSTQQPSKKDRAKGSETRAEGSSKRAEELESDKSKKQKLNEQVEAEVDDDKKEAEMKMYMKIILYNEIAIDIIPLDTKPSIITDWKIIKEGKMSSYHLIRADGSSKRYSSMIYMLQHIDREGLETLRKLVKAKYGKTRPKEGYKRVL
nr:hypothetical protein [Tanacetum cinerariifolium]